MEAIQDLLIIYEKASGKKNKLCKNYSFFSKNVSDSPNEVIKNLLGVLEIKEYEKYLGLLAVVGRNKKASLNLLKIGGGGNYKGGKRSCFLKLVKKFC